MSATDFLNRISLNHDAPEWKTSVTRARYNIAHGPDHIVSKFTRDNLTDNDAVIVSRLGAKLILKQGIDELYMADHWEILADNMSLLGQGDNKVKTINIRTLYKDDAHWAKSVALAKNIMSKAPPPAFVEKWPLLGSETFRDRMKQSDNDAVITLNMAMALSKSQTISIYHTEDWELLQEMINYSK